MLRRLCASKREFCVHAPLFFKTLVFVFLATLSPAGLAKQAAQGEEAKQAAQGEVAVEQLARAVDSGDFFEAEKIVKRIPSDIRKNDLRVLVLDALVEKGFYRTAAAYSRLKRALKMDKSHGDALFEMALLLMEKKIWRRAEVLLNAASVTSSLSDSRRKSIPYYLGVAAFESGRVFESRNHFYRLNWMENLDNTIRQSSRSYLSDIAVRRPWSVVAPVLVQHESNVLGLADGAELPSPYSKRNGSKVVYGLFGTWSDAGGSRPDQSPWTYAVRILSSQALDKEFQTLDLLFSEVELNWRRLASKQGELFKVGSAVSLVRLGGRFQTSTATLKFSSGQIDVSAGYEYDLARSSTTDRSAGVASFASGFELLQGDSYSLSSPAQLTGRLPVALDKSGEKRVELTFSPSFNWAATRRLSFTTADRVAVSRVFLETSQYTSVKNTLGVKVSFSLQPYVALGAGYDFDLEKRTDLSQYVRKHTYTVNVLGML